MISRAWMRAAFIAAAGITLTSPGWTADAPCVVPEGLVYVDATLPHTATAIVDQRELRIVVIGTASSTPAGVTEPKNAYPVQLEQALAKQLRDTRIAVINKSERGATAAQMVARFKRDILADKPALVIWQTGTVDAVKGIDVDDFGEALRGGIDQLRNHNVDVMLMDMQYSPVSSTLINVAPYKDEMRWIAQEMDVLLLHRYEIMLHWAQEDVINLTATDREAQRRNADLVHRCIGELLSDVIIRAAGVDVTGDRPRRKHHPH